MADEIKFEGGQTFTVTSHGQTGGITAAVWPQGEVIKLGLPKAVCGVHGEHEKQTWDTFGGLERRTYPFCPYCYGEWLARTFPVTLVEPA